MAHQCFLTARRPIPPLTRISREGRPEHLTSPIPESGVEVLERERRLSRELALMGRLHRLGLQFVRAAKLSSLLDEVVETAIVITRADMGNLQLLDPSTGALRI